MKPDASFSVEPTTRDGVACLALRGELDMAVTGPMTDALATIEDRGEPAIILDLRELTFLDSCGLRAILAAWQRAQENGHELRVVDARTEVRRVFEITRTGFVLDEPEVVTRLGQETHGDGSGRAADRSSDDVDA